METIKPSPLSVIEKDIQEFSGAILSLTPRKINFQNDAATVLLSEIPEPTRRSIQLELKSLTPENPDGSCEISVQDKHFECFYRANFKKDNVNVIESYFLYTQDITKHKEKLNDLKEIAYRDGLTALHNRAYLEQQFNKILQEKLKCLTIFSIDVDGLKTTNDLYGHTEGDNLLIAVSDILRNTFHLNDILARGGDRGDEFFVIAKNMTQQQSKEKIKFLKENCFRWNEYFQNSLPQSLALSFSVGAATFYSKSNNPISKEDIKKTIKIADNKMYDEKNSKKIKANLTNNPSPPIFFKEGKLKMGARLSLFTHRFTL